MYPPEFQQQSLPSYKPRNRMMKAPLKLPVSIRCGACRIKMCKGTKIWPAYRNVVETSLYYFQCTTCDADIRFKCDPKNSVYSAECRPTRIFETSQDKDEPVSLLKMGMVEGEKRKITTEEIGDAMNSLENTTLDFRGQMNSMAGAGLDGMTAVKASKLNMRGLPDEDDEPTSSSAWIEQTKKLSMMVEGEKRKRTTEEIGDSKNSLENTTLDSRGQMDSMAGAGLDEMTSVKKTKLSVEDCLMS